MTVKLKNFLEKKTEKEFLLGSTQKNKNVLAVRQT